MTPEELEAFTKAAAAAATAASQEATTKTFDEKAKTLASVEDIKSLQKQVEAGQAELQRIGDSVIKVSNAIKGVSLKDLGAGKSELNFNKALMYRGILLGNWAGADKEKVILDQCRAVVGVDGASGGYALPTEIAESIFPLVRDRMVIQALGCTNVSPRSMKFELPGVSTGSTGYMIGEGKKITESDLKFKLLSMSPKKAAALVYASREMIASGDPAISAIIEADMADALASIIMQKFLYGDGANDTPLGIANLIPAANVLATGADGDSPTQAFVRQLRSKVPQKYISNMFKFLANENTLYKAAAVAQAAATGVLASDEQLIANVLGKPYVSTGHVKADKAKGNGTNLSDLFYGKWDEVVFAQWWSGLRMETTEVGGSAFENDLMGFKAVLPFDVAVRRPDALAKATFVQTIG